MTSAAAAKDAATHEESRAEDKHDTRATEAGYLAGAQAARVAELRRVLTVLRMFPLRDLAPEAQIAPGALVELETNGARALYFLIPQVGGISVRVADRPVQVISPQSPLGDALLGRRRGEVIEVEMGPKTREYEVISVV